MQELLNDMVFFHINTTSEAGKVLRERFSINFTPQFLITNADVERVALIIGYRDPAEWITEMEKIVADPITITQRQVRNEQTPAVWDCVVLGKSAEGSGETLTAIQYYKQALELDPQLAAAENVPRGLFWTSLSAVQNGDFPAEEMEKYAAAIINDTNTELSERMLVLWKICRFQKSLGEPIIISYVKQGLKLSENSDDTDVLDYRDRLLVKSAVLIDKDLPKAKALKTQHMPEHWQNDRDELYDFAVWCYRNKTSDNEASEYLEKALKLSIDILAQGQCQYLLAIYAARIGNYEDAITYMESALVAFPGDETIIARIEEYRESNLK